MQITYRYYLNDGIFVSCMTDTACPFPVCMTYIYVFDRRRNSVRDWIVASHYNYICIIAMDLDVYIYAGVVPHQSPIALNVPIIHRILHACMHATQKGHRRDAHSPHLMTLSSKGKCRDCTWFLDWWTLLCIFIPLGGNGLFKLCVTRISIRHAREWMSSIKIHTHTPAKHGDLASVYKKNNNRPHISQAIRVLVLLFSLVHLHLDSHLALAHFGCSRIK